MEKTGSFCLCVSRASLVISSKRKGLLGHLDFIFASCWLHFALCDACVVAQRLIYGLFWICSALFTNLPSDGSISLSSRVYGAFRRSVSSYGCSLRWPAHSAHAVGMVLWSLGGMELSDVCKARTCCSKPCSVFTALASKDVSQPNTHTHTLPARSDKPYPAWPGP